MTPEYHDPERLDEVLALLREYGDDAKLVAGGQSLMVMLRQGLLSPAVLIDLDRIVDLRGIGRSNGEVRLGATTTIRTIEREPMIRAELPVLAEAAAAVGPLQVRNMGTIGGNVAHNALGADPPPALLALDARVTVAGPGGTRTLPLEDLLTGYFETALGPEEVLTEVRVPALPRGAAGGYLKFASRSVDMALVGVAVVHLREGEKIRDVRIAIGGAGPVPFRAHAAEASLRGRAWTEAALQEAGRLAARDAAPLSDLHASAEYRRWLVQVLVPRALARVGGAAAARTEP